MHRQRDRLHRRTYLPTRLCAANPCRAKTFQRGATVGDDPTGSYRAGIVACVPGRVRSTQTGGDAAELRARGDGRPVRAGRVPRARAEDRCQPGSDCLGSLVQLREQLAEAEILGVLA